MALRERFVLYAKLPQKYLPYITRSEADDEVGRNLTDALFRIYDSAVFMNDGHWDPTRSVEDGLRTLASVAGETLIP